MITAVLMFVAAIAVIVGEFIPRQRLRRVVVIGAGVLAAAAALASAIQQERSTTAQLRTLTSLAVAAEEAGQMELERDPEGNFTGGRVVRLKAGAVGEVTANADLTTHPKESAATSETTATADLTTHSK